MSHVEVGKLQAFFDGELTTQQRQAVQQHLQACTSCQSIVRDLQSHSELSANLMAQLEPSSLPSPDKALAMLQLEEVSESRRSPAIFSTLVLNQIPYSRRPALQITGMAALTLTFLIILFTIAPAREVMAQFLRIFRVQNLMAIPVETVTDDRLAALEEALQTATFAGPETLRPEGEPLEVTEITEASRIAGFAVTSPDPLLTEADLNAIYVVRGSHMRVTIARDLIDMVVTILGVTDAALPDSEEITLEVDLPFYVYQTYTIEDTSSKHTARFSIYQFPVPEVEIPPGIDPVLMGELYLRMSGLSADQASDLAQSIDWTSTLVLPIPVGMVSYKELSIHGAPAILLWGNRDKVGDPSHLLLWQANDIMYVLEANYMSDSAMVQLAESLDS